MKIKYLISRQIKKLDTYFFLICYTRLYLESLGVGGRFLRHVTL